MSDWPSADEWPQQDCDNCQYEKALRKLGSGRTEARIIEDHKGQCYLRLHCSPRQPQMDRPLGYGGISVLLGPYKTKTEALEKNKEIISLWEKYTGWHGYKID